MRTGIFGGTFDPVHVGHLAVAASAHAALGLDRLLLVVANEPWQKSGVVVTPAAVRYEAAAAAVADLEIDGLAASDVELRRGGPSFTIDTVEQLRSKDAAGSLFLVVGHDVVQSLDTWHRVEELKRLVTLAVVSRPGTRGEVCLPGWKVRAVEVPQIDVSSSAIRRRVAAGLPVDGLVPAAAMRIYRADGGYP
ncbi:MAG TPA: nicotinate-nucleotide adenylyltransferase [Acidimicrobiales bacterium]|nr:nicotinate-nucleotide adenylyltransferase [Acidimicrobiales bacterium]